MSECEWNPRWNRPALDTDPPHGKAEWSIGVKPNWHVCDSCVELPVFKRIRKKARLCRWQKIKAFQIKGGDTISWASLYRNAGIKGISDEVHHVVDDSTQGRVIVTFHLSGVHVYPYEASVFRAVKEPQ